MVFTINVTNEAPEPALDLVLTLPLPDGAAALAPEERSLFSRLCVFSGGWTLEAAEDIVGADLDTLQSLVDKSLVRHADDRFSMLETIREYGHERFRDLADEETVRDLHLAYYLALAQRVYEQLAAESDWFGVLDPERDNVRAALDWAAGHRPQTAAELAAVVAEYWLTRGHGVEARERLVAALAGHPDRDRARALALTELGALVAMFGEDREGLEYLQAALDLWPEVGGGLGEARALEMVGYCQIALGELDAARTAFEQSLAIRERVGAPAGLTSWQMFDRMLQDLNVVITPGSGFGPEGEGYFRISAFNSRANAEEVARRLEAARF